VSFLFASQLFSRSRTSNSILCHKFEQRI
jgi:hypothetical protein